MNFDQFWQSVQTVK